MRIINFILFVCMSSWCYGQEDVLLTINDEAITTKEFKRVYEKNLNLLDAQSENSPKDYLELFIDYKLKVQEAYKRELHKKETYKRELQSYKSQLAKSFLTDVEVTEELVAEAYDRTKRELKARHILIRVGPDALPEDTLSAFKKIQSLRSRIVQGEDFSAVARKESEDPSARSNGGDLGWFKAFKMVYPFESAAYNTPLNEVSQPFRTSFGYHIVEPTAERFSKGSVKVAHIMVGLTQKDSTINPIKRIKKVDSLLNQGIPFETLARNYSDDKNSATKGGVLSTFEQGQLSSVIFENKAFGLQNIGETTGPFKTKFGWHIIKLLDKKPIGDIDELKSFLVQKVTRDARSSVIDDKLKDRLRSKYNIQYDPEMAIVFEDLFPEKKSAGVEALSTLNGLNKSVFTIVDSTYTYNQLGEFLIKQFNRTSYGSKDQFLSKNINKFIDVEIKKYHLDHLDEQDDDFALLLKEYQEGLLLFDLLESSIWNKAQNDSLGLINYFQANRSKYLSPTTYKVRAFTTPSKQNAEFLRKELLRDKDQEKSIKKMRKRDDVPVLVTDQNLTQDEIPSDNQLALGVSPVFMQDDGYIFYNVLSIVQENQKSLEEARGLVMSDYQNKLEKDFTQKLRSQSTIDIKTPIMNRLISLYE